MKLKHIIRIRCFTLEGFIVSLELSKALRAEKHLEGCSTMCHFNALTFLFLNKILTCLPIRFLDLIFYDKNARLKSIGSKKYVLRLDRVALFFGLVL